MRAVQLGNDTDAMDIQGPTHEVCPTALLGAGLAISMCPSFVYLLTLKLAELSLTSSVLSI